MAAYSPEDFDDLCRAIRRYVEEGMDQWANFRLTCGDVVAFVSIGLEPMEGPEAAYPLYDLDA